MHTNLKSIASTLALLLISTLTNPSLSFVTSLSESPSDTNPGDEYPNIATFTGNKNKQIILATTHVIYYRIANAALTGWRPSVREFWMKDVNGVEIGHENNLLICSGKSSHTAGTSCKNAVDKVSPWWRPQCHNCDPNEAWIGYAVSSNVEVVGAYAKGLGIGNGGGYSWNGGVVLQKSEDLGVTWEEMAYADNSDFVTTLVYYRIANADLTGWRPTVSEFWMRDVNGVEIGDEYNLICSGTSSNISGISCKNAVDKVSPWWRPQCFICDPNEAWIGYAVSSDVEVVSAYAKGLGIGSELWDSWNGGVVLEKSEDLGVTWEVLAFADNSDFVTKQGVTSTPSQTQGVTSTPSQISSCVEGELDVTISVTTDFWPEEISWDVTSGNEIVENSPPFTSRYMAYVESICLDASFCYNFTIFDSAGDGINNDPGDFTVAVDNVFVLSDPDSIFTSLSVTFGDCSLTGEGRGTTAITIVSVISGLLFISCFCFYYCYSQFESRRDDELSYQTPELEIAQQQQNNDANNYVTSDEEEKQERRFKILTNIICKKVLPKQELPHMKSLSIRSSRLKNINDASIRSSSSGIFPIPFPAFEESQESLVSNNEETSNTTANKDKNSDKDEEEKEEDIIVAPIHAFPPSQSQDDGKVIRSNDDADNDSSKQQIDLKSDIYEQTMRSYQMVTGTRNNSSSLYSPRTCPICMEQYEAGNEIAWSKNEDCVHAFHLECILDWLMENDDCPMCRRDYLCIESTEV